MICLICLTMLECTRIFVIDEFQYLYSNINYFVHNSQMLVYIDIGVGVDPLTRVPLTRGILTRVPLTRGIFTRGYL